MSMNLFIKDVHEFQIYERAIDNAFLKKSGLPDQVFQRDFQWFVFEEFDWAMCSDFWPTLQELARTSHDTSLLMAVLEPEPADYYKKEFDCYNWAKLPTTASSDEYWALLNEYPESSPADSLLANSEKIVWLPQSARWALWGERSYGVCVLGSQEQMSMASWRGIEWALENCLPNCFRGHVVPPEFVRKLRLHYGVST